MVGRPIEGVALFVLILGPLCLVLNSEPAAAGISIYIRADGAIEGTDRIITDNTTYTFAEDLNNSIIVERDNIVIEGADHSLTGSGVFLSIGIELFSRSNVTIKDLAISGFGVLVAKKEAS